MPVRVDALRQLLTDSKYDRNEMEFLVQGFSEGFSIGYAGDETVQQTAPNLKLRVWHQIRSLGESYERGCQ